MGRTRVIRVAISLGCMALAVTGCQLKGVDVSEPGTMAPTRPTAEHERRLEEAMAGLVYEEDRVLLDPAVADEAGWATESQLLGLLSEAETLLGSGRAVGSIAAFTRAVIAAPDRTDPYEGLGRAWIREGRSRFALAAFLTALELCPDWTAVRFEVGNTLQRLWRLDDAVAVWQDVVDRDPGFADAHGRLAVAYYLLDMLALAEHHLAEAQALGGAVPAQLATMLHTGEPPRATVSRGHAAGRAPTDSPVVVGPQVRVNPTGGVGTADETTCIAIDEAPGQAIAAWNDTRTGNYRVGAAVTLDGGETWTDFVVDENDSFCDGMTAGDSRTGTLWMGGLDNDLGIFVSRHQAGTAVFDPPTYAGAADKPWMAAGRRPDDADSTRLYVTANIDFAYSDDLGQTWTSPGSVSSMYGIGHLPRVGPNGELYVAFWDLGYGVMMQRSFDGGATLSSPITIATRLAFWDIYNAPQIPGEFRVPPLTYLDVDPNDGTLYCVYFDISGSAGGNANVDLYFTRSIDHGDTWTTPTVINGDSDPPGDQFFSWLEVDSSGRLHVLFYDTRNTAQDDIAESAYLDAYYAWSEDGGDTWTEHRLTPASFNTGAASNFIGDYLGMGVGHGRAYPVYPFVENGVHQIVSNQIVWRDDPNIFTDGFESGDTSAWTVSGE